jgi:YgiT-type zinc finger domain-containing protein
MTTEDFLDAGFPCQECQGGISRLQYQTYVTWLREELMTVPNFPTWVCDLCGWREHDARAVAWLVTLLNPPERRNVQPRMQPWRMGERAADPQRTLPK